MIDENPCEPIITKKASIEFSDDKYMSITLPAKCKAVVCIFKNASSYYHNDQPIREYYGTAEKTAQLLYMQEPYEYYVRFCQMAELNISPRPIDYDKLIAALNKFREAYIELNKLWAEDSRDTLDNLDAAEKYPFHRSFNEIDITDWTTESIREMNQIKAGTKKQKPEDEQ